MLSVTVFWVVLAFHDDAGTYSWVILAVHDVGTYSFEWTILKNTQRQVRSGHKIQNEIGHNIDLGSFVKSWVMVGHKVKSEAGIVKMATCWDLQIVLYFEHQVIKSYIVTCKNGMGTKEFECGLSVLQKATSLAWELYRKCDFVCQ